MNHYSPPTSDNAMFKNFFSINIGHVLGMVSVIIAWVWGLASFKEKVSLMEAAFNQRAAIIESDITASKRLREMQLLAIETRLTTVEKSREETQSIMNQLGALNAKFEGLSAKVDGVKDALSDVRQAQREKH